MNDNCGQRPVLSMKSTGAGEKPAEGPNGGNASLPELDLQNITRETFDQTAEQYAKFLCPDANNNKEKNKNKGTQLRRFYDELLLWYERAGKDEDVFQEALPFIYMMKSKVAYACGREIVNENFRKFMNQLINQIDSRATLKNAKLFMEAVMGFYKQYNKD